MTYTENTPQSDIPAIHNPTDTASWPRREHFDYFYNRLKCKYNLNAAIDVSAMTAYCRRHGFRFFPSFLYVIMTAVNRNPEFRMSFDANGILGTWNYLSPSYTIFHEDDHTFSDIWSQWNENFDVFYRTVCDDIAAYGNIKGVQAKPGKPDNFCPVSCLPWLNFTGFAQDTCTQSELLFPIIRFGKYETSGDKTVLPLSVFVHHAVADGYHTCKLINDITLAAGAFGETISGLLPLSD